MSVSQAPVPFLDIGRRVNSIGVEYGVIEEAQRAMSEDSEQYCAAHTKLVKLLEERTALHDLAFAMQVKTLTDAAVQLGLLCDMLDEMCATDLGNELQAGDLDRNLARFGQALASITLAVGRAAGLDLDQICEPGLPARLRQHCGCCDASGHE